MSSHTLSQLRVAKPQGPLKKKQKKRNELINKKFLLSIKMYFHPQISFIYSPVKILYQHHVVNAIFLP